MRTSSLNKIESLSTRGVENNVRGKESILRVLAYFDIFRYPLTREEIRQFMDKAADSRMTDHWLSELQKSGSIFFYQGFYSLQDNPLIIHRRTEGEKRAKQLLKKAIRIGRFLYRFPFVRGIAVSGSLSKNFAEENADIDFFIITRSNRLWLARTLMHLFKKLATITGRQHYYCMNYYIDEESLGLEEKNIFTAIELKTLLPVAGEKTIKDFFNSNVWSDTWLPSLAFRKQEQKDPRNTILKRVIEWLFDNQAGHALDQYLLKLTTRRWKNKMNREKKNEKGIIMELITGRHFARSDPGNFQARVLSEYERKMRKILNG